MSPELLPGFGRATRAWFAGAYAGPTMAQSGAWEAIGEGKNVLVVAPTGSGKTLAAFLWAIDRLHHPRGSASAALSRLVQNDENSSATASGKGSETPLISNDLAGGSACAGNALVQNDCRHTATTRRCRILYVSPLKALAADVQRNLRAPLVGIKAAANNLGIETPEITIGMRTGDTPANERRAFAKKPPDILVTTPESLYLILTSGAREGLQGVETVIIDEIHAVAGTKRGAHLALSLERLDAYLEQTGGKPAQRIGLSATVEPADEVAKFLSGTRPITDGGRETAIVRPPSEKQWQIDLVVPVPDLTGLGDPTTGKSATDQPQLLDLSGVATSPIRQTSIWPHVHDRIYDLVDNHTSTLVFTNSRRGAERLTSRLNEIAADNAPGDSASATPYSGQLVQNDGNIFGPAETMGQSGTAAAHPPDAPVIARAHHGSMSRTERLRTESELKSGKLPAVVATSSLELGIDMGEVDLVVQVGAPPSVASGLQRIGRAGHQVGAVSHGVVMPTHRGDLIAATVIAEKMRKGEIEPLSIPQNPLDVLTQQVVAALAVDEWQAGDLLNMVKRAHPFKELGENTWAAVLDMLSGRYPSEDFGELRPRITWDRATNTLAARPGALRLAATSGGTIPDRGLYGVFLAGTTTDDGEAGSAGSQRGGKRVGELDEEMVFESRVGDTFTLGSSTWRIEEITPNQVMVTPAPGLPGRLPFWRGDQPARPVPLGRAIGQFTRELDATLQHNPEKAHANLRAAGLDQWAANNLANHLQEQRVATGALPTDKTLIIERFRDELGEWRVVIHNPLGLRVNAPWALIIAARLRERLGVDVSAVPTDDGIILRLPDADWGLADDAPTQWPFTTNASQVDGLGSASTRRMTGESPPWAVTAEDLLIDPDDVDNLVQEQLTGSVLFASRFREAAGRALLLPKRNPARRQPLWQQRLKASQLLQVASNYPQFPIVLEAVREVLQDDFDTAALATLQKELATGVVRLIDVNTEKPSPFASETMFGYAAEFLYNGDTPLAERRVAALALDPKLLEELLGAGEALTVAELLDENAVAQYEAELQRQAPGRQARTAEQLYDLLRDLGPMPLAELGLRVEVPDAEQPPVEALDSPTSPNASIVDPTLDSATASHPLLAQNDGIELARKWVSELLRSRRIIEVRLAGHEVFAVAEDAARLRDGLGVALPVGVPIEFTEPVPDPLGDLIRRHLRTHGPVTAPSIAGRFGLGVAGVKEVLTRLTNSGHAVHGALRPVAIGGIGDEWADPEVMRRLRRKSLAALRSEVEPVEQKALGVFLPHWQQLGSHAIARGRDGLLRAVEQLAGFPVPASALESLVLPARIPDYTPELLTEATANGEIIWAGHGRIPGSGGGDGLVSLHLADDAEYTLRPAAPFPAVEELESIPRHPAAREQSDRSAQDLNNVNIVPSHSAQGTNVTPSQNLDRGDIHVRIMGHLRNSGGYFLPQLSELISASQSATLEALWDLVWAGHVTNDSITPLREMVGTGAGGAHRASKQPARGRAVRPGRFSGLGRPASSAGTMLKGGGGRWSALAQPDADPTRRAHALTQVLLDRHGVVTKAIAGVENLTASADNPGGIPFSAIYRVLKELEERGRVRRGYFIEGLGGAQFALPGAVDLLRTDAADQSSAAETMLVSVEETQGVVSKPRFNQMSPHPLLLAATDPANPYGAALPWPVVDSATPANASAQNHGKGVNASADDKRSSEIIINAVVPRPRRAAGAVVVLVNGELVLYLERGGRSLLTFGNNQALPTALTAIVDAAASGRLGKLTISKINGAPALQAAAHKNPIAQALLAAGFHLTPSGFRLR